MNANDARQIQETKIAFQRALHKRRTKAGVLAGTIFLAALILSQFVTSQFRDALCTAGAALSITAMVGTIPDSFRGRTGSLTMAIGLIASMWLLSAAVFGLSIPG
jgi:hypothetical protein